MGKGGYAARESGVAATLCRRTPKALRAASVNLPEVGNLREVRPARPSRENRASDSRSKRGVAASDRARYALSRPCCPSHHRLKGSGIKGSRCPRPQRDATAQRNPPPSTLSSGRSL